MMILGLWMLSGIIGMLILAYLDYLDGSPFLISEDWIIVIICALAGPLILMWGLFDTFKYLTQPKSDDKK